MPLSTSLQAGITGDALYSGSYMASDAYAPAAHQNNFWRLNASAHIGDADGRWALALIGRNLTNKYYLLFAGDRTGGTSVPLTQGEQRGVVSRGREITVQGSFRF